MMKKYILITLVSMIALLLAAVLSGIAAAYIYPPAVHYPPQAECTVTLPVQPGEVISCTVPVTLPVNMKIANAEITGEHIMPLSVEISGGKYLWNRRIWHISGKFRILKEGKTGNLAFTASVRQIFSSRIRENIRIPLPEISSAIAPDVTPGAELLLAGELTPPSHRRNVFSWHWLWLVLPAAAGIAYWLWRKFFRRIILPAPWEKALQDVEKICSRVKHKKISPEKAFAMLCDVLRDYLEIRFSIPAPRRTTQEFMQDILHDTLSPLPEEQRIFLCRFLTAADMIKFACTASDNTAFSQVASRAGEFIRSTAEEGKNR